MGAYLATPAFANRTSSRPFSRWIWANKRSRSLSLETSPWTAVTLLPISLTAAASSGSRRPVMNTYAPSRANSFAVARPIPLLPPVTSAILPSSLPMLLHLPGYERLGLAERPESATSLPFSPPRPNALLCAKLSERTEPVLEVIGASDLAISDGLDVDRHDPKALARMRHTEKIAR